MKFGRRAKVFLTAIAMIAAAVGMLYALLRISSPGTPTEAYLARIIDEADVSDHFDPEGSGWDREDVTDRVCNRVTIGDLVKLGMPAEPAWHLPIDGGAGRRGYVWQVAQRKILFAACSDHSVRHLYIEIDAETLACKATVMPIPNCDM